MSISWAPVRSRFLSNHSATAGIYTLSLHDALPIFPSSADPEAALGALSAVSDDAAFPGYPYPLSVADKLAACPDRKSTRLNSSHPSISYAVFCLKKKNRYRTSQTPPAASPPTAVLI